MTRERTPRRSAPPAPLDMLALEKRHWVAGVRLVAGVDEAGMGALAGPVVAAAVVLDPARPVVEARDSKQLDASTRQRLDAVIRAEAVAVSVGLASVAEIAELNVYHAGLLAMSRAVAGLDPTPSVALVDARTVPGLAMPQEAHVKGDARSCSIAAASIVAKVHRDELMRGLALEHPGYGFERHAGYATAVHVDALKRLGPCGSHRESYLALAEHSGGWSEGYYRLRDGLRAVSTPRDLARWQSGVRAELADLSPEEARKLHVIASRRVVAPRARRRSPGSSPTLPLE